MSIIDAIILGVIEGIAEFLPISSTGQLTIIEKLMGYRIDDPGIMAFTAIIQIGATLAAVGYFREGIIPLSSAWLKGLFNVKLRQELDYKMGWCVIIGSVPVAIVGLLIKDHIEMALRSLWFVVAGLILWSIVLLLADRSNAKMGKRVRKESQVTWKDTLFIGVMQCLALIPGISRSGATISGGLFRGLDRVTAVRLSFFLGMPVLLSAGLLEVVTKADDISSGIGWAPTIIGMLTSFIVGYFSISWLLKFVSTHSFSLFIWYRVAVGLLISGLILTGVIGAI